MNFNVGDKMCNKKSDLVYDVAKLENGYVTLEFEDADAGVRQSVIIPEEVVDKYFIKLEIPEENECEHCEHYCISAKDWNTIENRVKQLDLRICSMYDALDEMTDVFQQIYEMICINKEDDDK